jgi:hypothetical protein
VQPFSIWSAGGDSFDRINAEQVTDFWLACFTGNVANVLSHVDLMKAKDTALVWSN